MEVMNFVPRGSAVCSQLLANRSHDIDRSLKISEQMYGSGVLEGNWLEDSAEVLSSIKDEWASLYETSYRPCKTEVLNRPKFEAWKQRILAQGIGARLMIDHHGIKYHNNWTTSHDLSFKILPHGLCGPRIREYSASKKNWLPDQDYTKVYGNLTEYGLTDFMRHKWDMQNRLIRPWRTNYLDDFPKHENASTVRFLKPKGSLNEPDLRHLGIDLLASCESCPIAFKTPKPQPYNTVLKYPLSDENIPRQGKVAHKCSAK